MLGLPEHGQRVRVYPFPGRQAQLDERPVDAMGAGRFIPKGGADVIWSPFMHSQLLGGALLLHPPPCDEHEHGERGQDDCANCGRDVKAAQQYDVDRTKGMEAAKAARDTMPLHPYELELHPQSDEMEAHRKEEAKAQEQADAKAKAADDAQAAQDALDDANARAAADAAAKAKAATPAPDGDKSPDPIK